jgi:Zn-dependent membrane protease YugP
MKLFIFFICVFFMFFGSVIAFKLFEFGLKVSDKALVKMGKLLMWPFAILFKIVSMKTEKYRVIVEDDRDLQSLQSANQSNRISSQRRPIVIEHERTLDFIETIKAKALPRKK